MTLPRTLFLLALGAGIVGLVLLFSREGPSPRPGDEAPGEHAVGAPDPLEGAASPGALPSESPPSHPVESKAGKPNAGTPKTGEPKTTPPTAVPPEARVPRPLRVFNDFDGEPIVGAEVAVLDDLPDLRSGLHRSAERPPHASGVTEADGSYVVAADAPRAGAVRVRARGFVEATVGLTPFPAEIRLARVRSLRVRVIDDHGRPIPGATVRAVGSSRDVEVKTGPDGRADVAADGTDWRRLEAFADGYVVALRDTTLSGMPRDETITIVLDVANPILGRVVADEDGAPIADATVALVSGAVEHGVFATTTSGSGGEFTLPVQTPTLHTPTLRVEAHDRLLGLVSLGQDVRAAGPIEVRLERGRTVDGIVKDGAGAPVAGARVQAVPVHPLAARAGPREAHTRAATNAQGRFQVRVPKAGSGAHWHIRARGPQGDWGTVPVQGAEETAAPFTIVLRGLGFLEGRVVSSDGSGVAGVRVRPTQSPALDAFGGGEATPASDGGVAHPAASGPAGSTLTVSDGTFRLGPLPAGDLELSLERDGRPLGRSVSVRVESGKTVTLDPIALGSGEISGVVIDPSGREAAGVFVRLGPVSSGIIGDLRSAVRDTRTDVVGRFRFVLLDPSERVSIQATVPTGEEAYLDGVLPRAEPFELQLAAPPQLVLRVTRGDQLYDGPLQVSFHGSLPPVGSSRGSPTLVQMKASWVNCAVGQVSIPVRVAAPYAVEVRSAEAEPATASGVSEVDPADRTTTRVTLDLRVPEPATPDAGMAAGR